jgi:ubiquinone/menaquinone biosynthesis C-methylase UbiE
LKSAIFPSLDDLYSNRNPLIRNLFWARINTAINLAKIRDDSVILDLGCGSGHLLKSIRKYNIICKCYATDIEDPKLVANLDCKFQIADVKKLPFENDTFSHIFVLDVLEHVRDELDLDLAINEISRALRPAGLVILSGPTESWAYKLGRRVLFSLTNDVSEHERHESDYHYRSVYELESVFIDHGFILSAGSRLPKFPLPALFRIARFEKQV